MIHTTPGSLKSSKPDQSLDSIWDLIFVLFLTLLSIGKFYFNLFAKYRLCIHRFNIAIKRDGTAEMGSWSFYYKWKKKKESGFPEISWQLSRDRNDTHILHVLIFIARHSCQMVWIESNWQRAVKRHRKAEVQAYEPLATLRDEARGGKKASEQTGPEPWALPTLYRLGECRGQRIIQRCLTAPCYLPEHYL